MWYRAKGSCANGDDCPFSHDDSIKLSGNEKKLCSDEMDIRYEYNNGKQPPLRKKGGGRSTSNGARSASPAVENQVAKDGKRICKFWLNNSCTRGKECTFAHYR